MPIWVWACASAALHALLALALLLGHQPDRAAAATDTPPVWMDALPPRAPEPPPVAAPEPPPQPTRDRPARVPRRTVAKAPAKPAAAVDPPPPQATAGVEPGAGVASDEGTLAIGSQGTGVAGAGTGRGAGGPGASEGGSEPERKQGPPQLSVWLDIDAFTRLALVRPGMALVMAVPGFRDMLRGSGLRPFVDLRLLRLSLGGVAAERLTLAGVHGGGQPALREVAERIAAMRNREPIWRGDAELQASAWVDGTGIDRGLAVHDGAFVIAPRSAMPELLGAKQPAEQVSRLSRLRDRVALLLRVEDAGRYLRDLQPCALSALRLSVAADDAGARLSITAHYRNASAANAARSCLKARADASRLASLLGWLARAQSAAGKNSTSLEIEVTSADIERLLNELAWALRSA